MDRGPSSDFGPFPSISQSYLWSFSSCWLYSRPIMQHFVFSALSIFPIMTAPNMTPLPASNPTIRPSERYSVAPCKDRPKNLRRMRSASGEGLCLGTVSAASECSHGVPGLHLDLPRGSRCGQKGEGGPREEGFSLFFPYFRLGEIAKLLFFVWPCHSCSSSLTVVGED